MSLTYDETLSYLYNKLPMFQRVGAVALKKDLTNIRKLCEVLRDPHQDFKSLHIAGTNGKGSVSNMLAAILHKSGYKVGLYTSPHLHSFTERIRINGVAITEAEVVAFVEKMRPHIEEIQPSFFEVTVAMAFDHFSRHNIDYAVVEVGMGGRLDSTNIITPELCVVTNISMDHSEHLGDTLAKIAAEKAGIFKEGVPIIIGRTQPETEPVFRKKAENLFAPIYFADERWSARRQSGDWHHQKFVVQDRSLPFSQVVETDLAGEYQMENVLTVLETIRVWKTRRVKLSAGAVEGGMRAVRSLTGFAGRMSVLNKEPLAIGDIAHNEEGLRATMAQIEGGDFKKLHFVLGLVNDKDRTKILALLPKDAAYYFVKPDVPRGLDVKILAKEAKKAGLKGTAFDSVQAGYTEALASADIQDLVYVGGSTFVVAEVI